MRIDFVLSGNRCVLTTEEVELALQHVDPEPLRSHAVQVSGRLYPVKQAFAEATGLDKLDFTTNQARTQLRRLGFELVRVMDARA